MFDALKILQDKGYQFIVITNQGGISKGLYNHTDVIAVHTYMQEQFSQNNIQLLDIFYCPHHAVNEKCICRKPDSLLLEKAIARYDVDKLASYFYGDSRRDVLAAEKAGVTGILITQNDSLNNYINQVE